MVFSLGDWFSKKWQGNQKDINSKEEAKVVPSIPVFDPVTGDIIGYQPDTNNKKDELKVFDVNKQAAESVAETDSRKDPRIEVEEKNRVEVCGILNKLTWENKKDLADYMDYVLDWDQEKMTSFRQKINQVADLSIQHDDLMNAISLLKGKNAISIGQDAKIEISNFIKDTFGDFDFDWQYQENYNRDLGTSLRKKLGHDDKTINQAISKFRNFVLSNNLADENNFNQYMRMFSINNNIAENSLNKSEYQRLMHKILKLVIESMEANFHIKADGVSKIKNPQEMQEMLTKFINEKSSKITFRNPENQSMFNGVINDILKNSIYTSTPQPQKVYKPASYFENELQNYYDIDKIKDNPKIIKFDPDKINSNKDSQ